MRVFVVGMKGERQTLAFDMDKFVAYNVDTRQLCLGDVVEIVHQDSEERLIKAYRLLDKETDGEKSKMYLSYAKDIANSITDECLGCDIGEVDASPVDDEELNDFCLAFRAVSRLVEKVKRLEAENEALREECDAHAKAQHCKKSAWEYIFGK